MSPRCFPRSSIFGFGLPVNRYCCEARTIRPNAPAATAWLPVDVESSPSTSSHTTIDSRPPPTHPTAPLLTRCAPELRLLPSSWASSHRGRRVLSSSSCRRATMSNATCRMRASGSGSLASRRRAASVVRSWKAISGGWKPCQSWVWPLSLERKRR